MNFPTRDDFLDVFGIEPTEEDPSMAYCRYVKVSSSGELEIDISFSVVSESFQIVLRYKGNEVAMISSEKVAFMEIKSNGSDSSIRVVFDIRGVTSEAVVKFEPELNFHWWTLRSE